MAWLCFVSIRFVSFRFSFLFYHKRASYSGYNSYYRMLYAWDMPVILSHIPFEYELRWMLNIFTLLIICTNMYDIYLCGVFNIVILANRIYTMLCWNIFDYIWNFHFILYWLIKCLLSCIKWLQFWMHLAWK